LNTFFLEKARYSFADELPTGERKDIFGVASCLVRRQAANCCP